MREEGRSAGSWKERNQSYRVIAFYNNCLERSRKWGLDNHHHQGYRAFVDLLMR